MNQKTITIIVVVIIILATLGFGRYYLSNKNKQINLPESSFELNSNVPINNPANEPAKPAEKIIKTVEGKIRSFNEKQVYLELADGKGAAINIEPNVAVKNKEKDANITFLKPELTVSVKVDESNNALEISIK